MPFTRLHYHLIWATADRRPILLAEGEAVVRGVIDDKARRFGVIVHAIGGTSDHVHVVATLPPALAVADCVRHFKGASSRAMNRLTDTAGFAWQSEYGAVTVGPRALTHVIEYVRHQREHHAAESTIAALERMTPHIKP